MKKEKKIIILFFFLVSTGICNIHSQVKFYVQPGKTTKYQSGSFKNPFSSLSKAIKVINNSNWKFDQDIVIYLRGGIYNITTPIILDEACSGKNGHQVIFKAYQQEKPVISGGIQIKDWSKVNSHIYKTTLNRNTKLRSLFVNGVRARMAGTKNIIQGYGPWGHFLIKGDESWAFGKGMTFDGIKFSSVDLPPLTNPEDIEIVQTNSWTEKIACARSIKQQGDTLIIKLQQPYGAILASLGWAAKINCNKSFYIRNAFELLDEPGEFYFNKKTHTLYYYTRGENMATAEVIAPTSNGLFKIYGSSTQSRVHDLSFEGLTFTYDDWNLMDIAGSHGFGGVQSIATDVKYIPDGNWHTTRYNSTDIPRGTIDVKNSYHITFINNRFEHLGSATTISLVNDVTQSKVIGNYFNDLAGNAINIGHPQHYMIGDGAIYANGIEGICRQIEVTDNYIRNVCLDFRQVEGISSFYVQEVKIDHNDIANVPYCGISCGWGSGNSGLKPSVESKDNSISFNRIGNTNYALHYGGSLYLLGEQPHSKMTDNYIYRGKEDLSASLSIDDGTAYWDISHNVFQNGDRPWLYLWSSACHDITMKKNFVENNLLQNNGTRVSILHTENSFRKPFSAEADKIIEKAGLDDQFKKIIPSEEPPFASIYPNIMENK